MLNKNMNETETKLYTSEQVREMLNLTYNQLYNRANIARIPKRKGEGGYSNQIYYTKADIEAIRCAHQQIKPRATALPSKTQKPKRAYKFKRHGTK